MALPSYFTRSALLIHLIFEAHVQKLGHVDEQFRNVGAVQCRRLCVVEQVVLFLELNCELTGDLAHLLQVRLVAGEEDQDVGRALRVDLVEPVLEVFECLPGVDWEAEHDGVCVAVEDLGHRAEVFLASCVPNLELGNTVFDAQQE